MRMTYFLNCQTLEVSDAAPTVAPHAALYALAGAIG